MTFQIIVYTLLFGLTLLCFWLPNKNGSKGIGLWTSIVIGLILAFTLLGDLSFLVIFIWPAIFAIQVIFISYWTFRLFGLKTIASISAVAFGLVFLFIGLEPWISDWTFSKNDAKGILSDHGFALQDDFQILENESGGFLDYAHSFTLNISESDHKRLSNEIRNSKNFIGYINGDIETVMVNNKNHDTVNYETENWIEREYYTKEKKEDGTYHFIFQLSKRENKIRYLGINE